jgi:flagellar protein FlaG
MNILPTDRSQVPAPAPAAGVPVAPVAGTAAVPSRDAIARAVARANEQMAAVAPSLEFEVDPDTRQVVIRLVDREDKRVLRQVPSPEMLEIARALDRMQSLLLRGKA